MEPRTLSPSSVPAYSLDMQMAGVTPPGLQGGQASLGHPGPSRLLRRTKGCSTHSVLTGTLGSAGTLRDGGSVNGEGGLAGNPCPQDRAATPSRTLTEALHTESAWNLLKLLLL